MSKSLSSKWNSKNRKKNRMIRKDDNLMRDPLPTDIVIPCASIHLIHYHCLLIISALWAQPVLEKALYASRELDVFFLTYICPSA
jgi:hypothetical protein